MTDSWRRFLFWFSSSSFGSWFMKRFMEPIDPWIYKVTKGKWTSAGPVVIPQLTLTTTGRKSGEPRTVRATVQIGPRDLDVTAERLTDEEKERVWGRIVAAIPNYAVYKERTDRNIKVYRLSPGSPENLR